MSKTVAIFSLLKKSIFGRREDAIANLAKYLASDSGGGTPIREPYSYTAVANTASWFHDCGLIFYDNFTDDGYAIGNMGSNASFVFPFFDIPETKLYNFELTYACGHPTGATVNAQLFNAATPSIIVTLPLTPTGGWITYQTVSGTISLNKGVNLVRIRRASGSESFNTSKLRIFES